MDGVFKNLCRFYSKLNTANKKRVIPLMPEEIKNSNQGYHKYLMQWLVAYDELPTAQFIHAKGKAHRWVTNIAIHPANVINITKAGRCRWKIENGCVNTLKNQGYHIPHNYGHGHKTSLTTGNY
jgi:hypothetical protein